MFMAQDIKTIQFMGPTIYSEGGFPIDVSAYKGIPLGDICVNNDEGYYAKAVHLPGSADGMLQVYVFKDNSELDSPIPVDLSDMTFTLAFRGGPEPLFAACPVVTYPPPPPPAGCITDLTGDGDGADDSFEWDTGLYDYPGRMQKMIGPIWTTFATPAFMLSDGALNCTPPGGGNGFFRIVSPDGLVVFSNQASIGPM